MKKHAFTLVEVLVVVVAIAILAIIAIPNTQEARNRSKIARSQAVLAEVATALEAYHADFNQYPYDGYSYNNSVPGRFNYWFLPYTISTPVAYLETHLVPDPFREGIGVEDLMHPQYNDIRYRNVDSTWGTAFDSIQTGAPVTSAYYDEMLEDVGHWILHSSGPDGFYGPSYSSSQFPGAVSWPTPSGYPSHNQPYDPTNGANSWGDIMRTQINPNGYSNMP